MSWAVVAVTAIVGGTVLQAAGQIRAGKAAEAQAEAEQEILNQNAKLKEREAAAERERSRAEALRFEKEGEALLGTQQVKLAKGGVLTGIDTPALLLELTAQELEADRMEILKTGFLAESFRLSEAENLRFQGRAAKARGINLKRASRFAAGGTLLTGIGAAGLAGSSLSSVKPSANQALPRVIV